MANATRKIRLKGSILIKGEHHHKGTVLEAPAPLAQDLVGSGIAEYHADSVAEVAAANQKGLQVHVPHADDPEPRKVSEAPAGPAPAGAQPKAKSGK